MDNVDYLKKPLKKIFVLGIFAINPLSNVCKNFFACFNALETNSGTYVHQKKKRLKILTQITGISKPTKTSYTNIILNIIYTLKSGINVHP